MLAFSFFAVVFSSLLWIIYSLKHVVDVLGAGGLANAGISDISVYVAFVLLPVFAIWIIFGLISQYLNNQGFNKNLQLLFRQMKKNQDYSDLLARIMLEERQHLKDGFVIQQFDLFVSDLNELISEIIQRASLASNEQIDHLWNKVRNGGKWSFGKVIIEINHNQKNFQMRVYEKTLEDKVLAGTIMEFCARYLNIVDLFEKHDREKIFLGTFETGVMGKVFYILSPISEEIRRNREATTKLAPREPEVHKHDHHKVPPHHHHKIPPHPHKEPHPLKKNPPLAPHHEPMHFPKEVPFEERSQMSVLERPKVKLKFISVLKKIGLIKPRKRPIPIAPEIKDEIDPLSLALERSFGAAAKEEPSFSTEYEEEIEIKIEEPEFSISLPENDAKIGEEDLIADDQDEESQELKEEDNSTDETEDEKSDPVEMTHTLKTIDALRKEWEDMKAPEKDVAEQPLAPSSDEVESEEKDEEVAYPFGGWANEENYHK